MKKLLQKNKSSMIFAIFAGFWLLVMVLFYFFVYQWQEQEILTLQNIINKEKDKTQQIESFIEKYPDISKYEQEIQDKINLLNMKLPNNDGIADFLIVLENNSKKTGVKISNIKPNAPINKINVATYNVEISVHGNYFQTLNFLKAMEDIPRFNIVNNLGLQSKDQMLNTKIIFSIFQYGNASTNSATSTEETQKANNKSEILTAPRANKPQAGVNI